MKNQSFFTASIVGIIFCSLVVIIYMQINDTKYANEREALMNVGLSSAEATELAEIEAIIRKLETEKLTIKEFDGIYLVVDEANNAVKKTENIKRTEINYIIKKIQNYKESEPIPYKKMLQDVAAKIKEMPNQGIHRVTYANGTWLEVEILNESTVSVTMDRNPAKATYNNFMNASYPNEIEISKLNIESTSGTYECSYKLRLYTGLYYIQSYLKQTAEFSENMENVIIKNIEKMQTTSGIIKLADSNKYVNVETTEKGNNIWCQVECQDTYKISTAIGVALSDPFSAVPTIGHNWTRYTIIRTSPNTIGLYDAYYSTIE